MHLFHVPQQIHERRDATGLCDGLRVIGSPCEIPQRPGGGCFLVVRPKAYQRHESGKAPERTNDTGRNRSADPHSQCTRGQCTRPARCDDPRALWINNQRVAMSMRGCGRAGSRILVCGHEEHHRCVTQTSDELRRAAAYPSASVAASRPEICHDEHLGLRFASSPKFLQKLGKLAQRDSGTIRAQVSTYYCTVLTLFLPRRAAQRHIFREAFLETPSPRGGRTLDGPGWDGHF